jgi:molybdopterin-guanine dinucleotide biosynthesis protein
MSPAIVGGFSSDSGKTTLLCKLLRALDAAGALASEAPVYTRETLPQLVARIRAAQTLKAGSGGRAV